ncbi:MAG: gamma-glutamylcyclotransferase [Streptosporangiales bacterium]|nr:gamma-glutamylcyclotransferase [Streptosporangiales bacterium]
MVHMFLNGGGMADGPLHPMLGGAPLVARTWSAPHYRFYAVRGEYPAMVRAADGEEGHRVAGEVYDLPLDVLRDSLLPVEPAELELGVIELDDGAPSLAMVLRKAYRGDPALVDISELGSWRAYQDAHG